jgi:hypothetical protein
MEGKLGKRWDQAVPSRLLGTTRRKSTFHFNIIHPVHYFVNCLINVCMYLQLFPPPPRLAQQPNAGQGRTMLEISRSHTVTHHNSLDSCGWGIGALQRAQRGNTYHSQETDIHTPGGFRTLSSSKRATADPQLRPLWHWDRHIQRFTCEYPYTLLIYSDFCYTFHNINLQNNQGLL